MSKRDPSLFRQLPPPELSKIFTISQPESELIFEHWRHLISSLEWEIEASFRVTCLMYKSKACVSLICFQQGCLLYQKKFKILYGQVQEITCLKMHPLMIKHQTAKKREIVTLIGFFDGSIELYHLSITPKSIVFKKLLSLEGKSKKPVTSIIVSRGHLFVSRLHDAEVYKDSLGIVANIIVSQEDKSLSKEYNCRSSPIPTDSLGEGLTLSMSLGKNSLHVFNESEGSKSFLLDSLEEYGTILDSITFMKETLQQNLVIGDTNDKLKIIYKSRKLVERYQGFKNFCSDAVYRVMQRGEELWVADYHGCITYFVREVVPLPPGPAASMKMTDCQTHFSVRVCPNGIKKMSICGKLLVVLDSESDIHFFDIVRRESESESEDVELQSVEEYSSDP